VLLTVSQLNYLVHKVMSKCETEIPVLVVSSGFVSVLGVKWFADNLPALGIITAAEVTRVLSSTPAKSSTMDITCINVKKLPFYNNV